MATHPLRAMSGRRLPRWQAVAIGALLVCTGAARAGILEDDEARRAILDLRTKLEQQRTDTTTQLRELQDQVQALQRSLLELNNQNEQLRAEVARLRGQDEQMLRDVSELQRRQKDIAQGVDERMRRFEPQPVSVDGKEFTAEPEEKRMWDDAMATLRAGEFDRSVGQLNALLKRYPQSGYAESARYWLGNAQYGVRQYKEAVATFRAFVAASPNHPRAPEALLAMANCQAELKDTKGARATIAELVKTYPRSEAAQAGRDRLATLK